MNRGTPTPEQLPVLRAQDDDTLAEWYSTLNRFGWPDGLDDPEQSTKWAKVSNRGAVMQWITEKLGRKKLLHHHHTVHLGRSEEEFAEWWSGNYEGDEAAKKRCDERLRLRIEKEDKEMASTSEP